MEVVVDTAVAHGSNELIWREGKKIIAARANVNESGGGRMNMDQVGREV
jgi:hypothetical protein